MLIWGLSVSVSVSVSEFDTISNLKRVNLLSMSEFDTISNLKRVNLSTKKECYYDNQKNEK